MFEIGDDTYSTKRVRDYVHGTGLIRTDRVLCIRLRQICAYLGVENIYQTPRPDVHSML